MSIPTALKLYKLPVDLLSVIIPFLIVSTVDLFNEVYDFKKLALFVGDGDKALLFSLAISENRLRSPLTA